MKKDYIEIHEGAERRFFDITDHPIEVRADGEKTKVSGIAAVVNKRANIGYFDEMVMPGAFEGRLNDDVLALFNHEPNLILARSTNGKGTLRLSIDAAGNLAYEYDTPQRSYALDLLDAIQMGDVDKSSFAFRVAKQEWELAVRGSKQNDLRKIILFERLYDVSPVTVPAYQDTKVGARSLEAVRKELETQDSVNYKLNLRKRQILI